MGLASGAAPKLDSFREHDTLVVVCAYAAGTAVAVAAVAISTALAAYGWKEVGWVLAAPGPQGVMQALGVTGLIVLVALPVTVACGFLAAVSANDPSIGGLAGRAVRESIEWSSGIPPAVIGVAVFFCTIVLHGQNAVVSGSLALVLLNLPNATARFAHAFLVVPRHAREAAAALGASPVAAFFGLYQPAASWAIAAVLFTLAAQMTGETSAIAIAMSGSDGPEPLSVQIWHFASNGSMAASEAAACIVLVAAVAVFLALARACARRNTTAQVAER